MRASAPLEARLAGDWAPVDAVVLTISAGWPQTLAPLLDAIAGQVPVDVLVQRGAGRRHVRRFIAGLQPSTRERITVLEGEVDSPWVRDYGPLQLQGPDGPRWLDAAYVERPLDDAVPTRLAQRWSVPVDTLPWSIDGGALVSDGDGLCISTFDYFETHRIPRRGPILEREILPAIGCEALVFVSALLDEDTGHVDMFMQFLDRSTLAISSVDPGLDPDQARRLDDVAHDVDTAAARLGLPLRIVRVPMGIELAGDLLPYVNGLRVGDAFLMPAYYDVPTPTEVRATAALAAALPGVEIVRIPTAEMADLGGALHCAALGLHGARRPADGA